MATIPNEVRQWMEQEMIFTPESQDWVLDLLEEGMPLSHIQYLYDGYRYKGV